MGEVASIFGINVRSLKTWITMYGPWVCGQERTNEGFNWDKSVIMICLWIWNSGTTNK